MSQGQKPLTPKSLALIAAGLFLLVALTIYRFREATPPDRPTPVQQRVKSIVEPASQQRTMTSFSGPTMGTQYSVKVVSAEPLAASVQEKMAADISEALALVDAKMSTYRDDSELSRFNAAKTTEAFPLSSDTISVMAYAQRISAETGGAFDITVGPLVNAWGFGPDGRVSPPSESELAKLRQRVGYEKITVDTNTNTVRKSQADIYCDLSAIAKGYAVDHVALHLDDYDLAGYMIEVGGEVRTKGTNADGGAWRIGIEQPDTGERRARRVIGMSRISMATSGDYRNFYTADGARVSHTIDPRTGSPVRHGLASVTVLANQCLLADAYATALMVLGPEEGYRFAEEHNLAALFIMRTEDGGYEERTTNGFAGLFVDTAPEQD